MAIGRALSAAIIGIVILEIIVIEGYDKEVHAYGGVHYVRWGRTTCREGAVPIYVGYMAGKHFEYPGGSVTHLCLNRNPKFGKVSATRGGWSGKIFGTELDVEAPHETGMWNQNGNDGGTGNKPMPCVLCYAPDRTSQFMNPGTNECPNDHTTEYSGYLVTNAPQHAAPDDIVCLDADPETSEGSAASRNENVVYPVESQCGSLPCNVYPDFYELTCAVCSL